MIYSLIEILSDDFVIIKGINFMFEKSVTIFKGESRDMLLAPPGKIVSYDIKVARKNLNNKDSLIVPFMILNSRDNRTPKHYFNLSEGETFTSEMLDGELLVIENIDQDVLCSIKGVVTDLFLEN